MTHVVAGLIEKDGRVLICRRREDQPHPGKWEFPGGKVEEGEAADAALSRELREELGIDAIVGREVTRYEYSYPGKNPILLMFFEIAGYSGELINRIFDSIAWESPGELARYDFLEGDAQFLGLLSARPD